MNNLPIVWINVAMSADGKIAPATRRFVPFGSVHDHARMYELRSCVDAVMSGARTVDLGEVDLGPGDMKYRRKRLKRGLPEFYPRIIVSGSGSLDPGAAIFNHRFSPIILLTSKAAPEEKLAKLREVATEVASFGDNQIDFHAALAWLKQKWAVNQLLCEGGGEINAALLEAGLVDEVFVTVCPLILGGRTAPTLADGTGFEQLTQASRLELLSMKRKGQEMFLHWKVNKARSPQSKNVPWP